MEWGEHWLAPIHDRLASAHPWLSAAEIDAYDEVCRAVMRAGHDAVADALDAAWSERGWTTLEDIDTADVHRAFAARMSELAPWASDETLGRLFSQGMYYALK
jgi:hypothetical protein